MKLSIDMGFSVKRSGNFLHRDLSMKKDSHCLKPFSSEQCFAKVLPHPFFLCVHILGYSILMWYVMKDNKYYEGGTFPNLEYELLNLENGNRLPIFRNYEDLHGILTTAFQMCEDMTTEFLNVYGDPT